MKGYGLKCISSFLDAFKKDSSMPPVELRNQVKNPDVERVLEEGSFFVIFLPLKPRNQQFDERVFVHQFIDMYVVEVCLLTV